MLFSDLGGQKKIAELLFLKDYITIRKTTNLEPQQ